MKSNRKGIALLWVVLTSALILVAILGISMRVVPQKKIENSREYTQRALAVAESGLANATYMLRTSTTIQDALDPAKNPSQKYDSLDVAYGSGTVAGHSDSTYQVVVKRASNGYTFYALGTFLWTGGNVLARQAISVAYSIDFPFGKYSLYSEKKIDLHNGIVSGADIYGDTVDIKNGSLEQGTAYYHTSGLVPSEIPSQQVATVSLPTINMDKYRAQWNAFLNGDYPYNGATDYPNTKDKDGIYDPHAFIINALGGTDGGLALDTNGKYSGPAYQSATTGTGNDKRAAGFEELFRELRNPSLSKYQPDAVLLKDAMEAGKLVFDVQPNSSGGAVDFKDAQLFSAAPYLKGVVIVEGDLTLSSNNLQIGVDSTPIPSKTAVLVSGMCTVGNAATINGFLYIAGEGKHGNDPLLSCKLGGGLTVNGSIVAKGTISATSAVLRVTWNFNDVYNKNLVDIVPAPSAVPSSWRQISYDAFLDATK